VRGVAPPKLSTGSIGSRSVVHHSFPLLHTWNLRNPRGLQLALGRLSARNLRPWEIPIPIGIQVFCRKRFKFHVYSASPKLDWLQANRNGTPQRRKIVSPTGQSPQFTLILPTTTTCLCFSPLLYLCDHIFLESHSSICNTVRSCQLHTAPINCLSHAPQLLHKTGKPLRILDRQLVPLTQPSTLRARDKAVFEPYVGIPSHYRSKFRWSITTPVQPRALCLWPWPRTAIAERRLTTSLSTPLLN
jgi:hypothetical protein